MKKISVLFCVLILACSSKSANNNPPIQQTKREIHEVHQAPQLIQEIPQDAGVDAAEFAVNHSENIFCEIHNEEKECYLSLRQCNSIRQIEIDQGQNPTECQSENQAYCASYMDTIYDRRNTLCFADPNTCLEMVAFWMDQNSISYRYSRIQPCSVYQTE